MELSIIVAVAHGNAIGRGGGLLCRLPADMRHFKAVTTGHTVIMGRLTYDSLPKGALPERRNIVVTRNKNFSADRVEVAHSFDEALQMAGGDGEVFVIGGAAIYGLALPVADKIYLTEIDASFPDADTFFPEFDRSEWDEVAVERHLPDERNHYAYRFLLLRRRK